MALNCNSCNGSSFSQLDKTWSRESSLSPSNYNPLKGVGNWTSPSVENYGCGASGTTLSTAWTRSNNVTPANTFAVAMKEGFAYNSHNTYARIDQTWNKQLPYTSN